MMLHHSTCPVCSGSDLRVFHSCTDNLVTGTVFELLRCNTCGFILTQDAPGEEDIARYYESPGYISHSDTRRTMVDKIYQVARNIMLSRKTRMVSRECAINRGEILDVGSGTGHFLYFMKNAGWNVTGIEINQGAREYSERNFGLSVFPPEHLKTFSSSRFDCITLWHVLEHLYDPVNYFGEIRRVLKPGGTVIVALPNSNSYDAGHFEKYWAAWDVPRHLWHFNPLTFKLFAQKSGFKIISETVLPFDVFYISVLSERAAKKSAGMLTGMMWGMIFWFISLFAKKRASSLAYILRVPSH